MYLPHIIKNVKWQKSVKYSVNLQRDILLFPDHQSVSSLQFRCVETKVCFLDMVSI